MFEAKKHHIGSVVCVTLIDSAAGKLCANYQYNADYPSTAENLVVRGP
jgi:hypothetical protein